MAGPGDDLPAVGTKAPHASTDEVKATEVAPEIEEKRKAKSKVFYERKKQLIQLRLKATKRVEEQLSSLQHAGTHYLYFVGSFRNGSYCPASVCSKYKL
jgi:hypothetical protein